jgi:hypothetical protein
MKRERPQSIKKFPLKRGATKSFLVVKICTTLLLTVEAQTP